MKAFIYKSQCPRTEAEKITKQHERAELVSIKMS